jgi:release factor glutamine methyltransferase
VEVADVLHTIERRLDDAGCETPRVDAALLVAHVLKTSRSELALARSRELSEGELERLEVLVARRERREPLAYVLGEWGFRRLTLGVDPRVLVPRPETEIVVERCLARLRGSESPHVLDVGTGSGAIALAIADELPGASVTATDVSEEALAVARANAARAGLAISFVRHDLFAGLPEGPWDLVVSNPPYVRPDEVASLQQEVREWEPRVALLSEGATEEVARRARDVLRPGGALVLEVADGDAERVRGMLEDLGYDDVETTPDLTGRPRVVDGLAAHA